MPITPHIEKHFLASALVRDIVIGMADGLTVPFALAAGLSGAVSSTSIIITAGLAEVAAGGLAMVSAGIWPHARILNITGPNCNVKRPRSNRFRKASVPRSGKSYARKALIRPWPKR